MPGREVEGMTHFQQSEQSLRDHIALLNRLRAAGVVFSAYVIYHRQYFDELLQRLYAKLLLQPLFHYEGFEILQSSVCFFFFIGWWYIVDHNIPILHKYRFNGANRSSWKGRCWVVFRDEVSFYVVPWLILAHVWPGRREILINSNEIYTPTLFLVVTQTLCSLATYDIFFYAGHRLVHEYRPLYSLHAKHHSVGANVTATDAIRHDFLDGTFDVMCSVLALLVVRSHPLSRLTHNIAATWLITESHSGYLLPCSLSELTGGFFSSPELHVAHHASGKDNYSKFFPLLDRVLGTSLQSSVIDSRQTT